MSGKCSTVEKVQHGVEIPGALTDIDQLIQFNSTLTKKACGGLQLMTMLSLMITLPSLLPEAQAAFH